MPLCRRGAAPLRSPCAPTDIVPLSSQYCPLCMEGKQLGNGGQVAQELASELNMPQVKCAVLNRMQQGIADVSPLAPAREMITSRRLCWLVQTLIREGIQHLVDALNPVLVACQ